MNDLFDRLGAAAQRMADNVSTEVRIAAQEQKLKEAYQALGKHCFHAQRNGQPIQTLEFADYCREAEICLKNINELKNHKDLSGQDYETVD